MSFAIVFGPAGRLDALRADWNARLAGSNLTLHSGEGMLVAAGAEECLRWSADRRAVALGLLLDAATDRLPEVVDLSGGAPAVPAFLRLYWGRYVLAGSAAEGDHWLFRDPSGGQAAHHLRDDERVVFVSDSATAATLGLNLGGVDPLFLAQWLAFPFLRTRRTGFERVTEILPGELYRRSNGEARTEALWTPAEFVRAGVPAPDFDAAAEELGALLRSVVPVMLSGSKAPLVQLSGGLDSAIVVAALGCAGQSFTAANYHGPGADSDERRFARLSAHAANVALHEFAIPAATTEDSPPAPRSFRPLPNSALRPLFDALDQSVGELGADCLVDGAGGDNLFCFLTTAAPAVDAFRSEGPRAAHQTLDDLAALTGATVWTALIAALRKQARARSRPGWRSDTRFLDSSAVPETCDQHPWLDLPKSLPPGKREHIEALVSIQHFLDRGQPLLSVPMHHPLLAQPLLEYCLGVPSWLWCHGGRDRAVARAAMRGSLPPEIFSRRSKGRLESLFVRTYRARRLLLRDQLLGGGLAARGLLDMLAINNYLLREGDPSDDGYVRLLEVEALENWLRSAGR